MSTEAGRPGQSDETLDPNATMDEVGSPTPGPSATPTATDATGEFTAEGFPAPDRGRTNAPGTAGPDAPATVVATGEFLEGSGHSPTPDPDATVDSLPVEARATGHEAPPDPGSTGVYVPEPTQALTGAFDPNRDQATVEATGMFVPGASGPDPGGGGGLASTEVIGAYRTTLPATDDGRGPTRQERAAPDVSRCGRYILKRFHAKGGMGEVWLAEDPAIGRSVALKRMLGRRPDQQHRFRLEAQVTGQLEHPGVVPVHELGVNEEGLPFYAMKFVQGRTLQKVIEEFHAADPTRDSREREQLQLLQVFISLCQTVAYAHSQKVLHRDLKPENVMLGSYGETLLLDWGIAKRMTQPEAPSDESGGTSLRVEESGEETETRVGAIMGTPSYMAPEVAAGLNDEVDYRSDVYLLGATLYEILTGKQPRRAKTAMEMVKLAQREPPVPAVVVNARVPKALDAICRKAMAHRKEDRYAAALDLAEDVQRFVAGEPVSAYREGFAARAWRWARRHRKALARSAAASLILAATLFGVARVREAERRRAEAAREAERLKEQDQARRDLAQFRHLADEARFYASTTDPVSEHSPYFDPRKGEATALAALALASKWGPKLDRLPLPEERDLASKDLYDLILLTAQLKGGQAAGPKAAREPFALLDEAGRLRPPSRGYHRLRAQLFQQLGEPAKADEQRRLAEDPRVPATSLDEFLLGEDERRGSASRPGGQGEGERKDWEFEPGRAEKAIDHYRRALAIDPGHYWSHFQRGRILLNLGRFSEAVEALGACVALRPEAPWGYSVRGLAFAMQKDYEEAEQDLDRAVALSPGVRAPRLNRGVVLWQEKKDDAALADFQAVLQPPDEQRLVEAAFYRGQLYLQQNKVLEALEDFDLVARESPGFRPVYEYRARILFAQGHNDRALEDLDSYLGAGRGPVRGSWESHARRGRVLRYFYAHLPQEKRREPSGQALRVAALGEFRKALDLGGRSAALFDDLGAMLEHSGRLGEALAAYSQGLRLAPGDARLLLKRGWAYDLAGQDEKAEADFAAAIRADPENAEAHTGLGYVRALRKLGTEAQREAGLAVVLGGENHMVLHNAACIYATLSQAPEPQATANQEVAIALLRRAVEIWKRKGTGPSEIDLIKGEPAFKPLQGRADFRKLIEDGSAAVGFLDR